MATSGKTSVAYADVNKVSLQLRWTRTSYSVTNNTSTISWALELVSTGGLMALYSDRDYTVTINGETFTGKANINISGNTTKTLASGSNIVIKHNTNGTKTFNYSFSIVHNSSKTVSGSGTGTLDTIPRQATISSAVDFNDEDKPTITYSNISGNLVDSLDACISLTGAKDDVPYREISKTGSTYTFNLTNNEREILRNAITEGTSRTVRFYVRTKIGTNTFYSYLTKTLTLINHEPIFYPSVTDVNATTAMLTGDVNKMVRYHSNANVTFAAIARKGATITKKTAINGSQSISLENTNQEVVVINNVDDNVFNLSVTDSRGVSTSQQIHFKGDNFIPYFNVTCAQTIRLNLDNTIDMKVEGKYYDGSFGAEDNELFIETRYRENGGSWRSWTSITPLISDISDGTYTLNTTLSGYNPSGTYDFQCRAIDKLTTAESAIETVTLKPLFDWGWNDFNFNVPVTFEGDTLSDFVIEEGTEEMGTNGTWYWSKWKSGKAECYGCRNYGNMGVSTAWGGLYRSSVFTQALPSGLFSNTPEVIDISLRSGSYGGWIARHEESAPSESSSGSFIVVRPASATISQAYICFNIVGRWK